MTIVPSVPACLARAMSITAAMLLALALVAIPSGERLAAPLPAPTAPVTAAPNWVAEAPPPNPNNLLHNSSLEYCTVPDMPDWWRPGEAWSDFRAANFGVQYALGPGAGRFHD